VRSLIQPLHRWFRAKPGSRPWIAYRAARVVYWLLTNENYRNAALVRLAQPRNLFQPDNFTLPDRYPHLFEFAARELGDEPETRILSFGCSTGEEAFALREYFPGAQIKGVDINRHNIAICNRKLARHPDPAISFAISGSAADQEAEVYDAIFCMAVFRHGALADSVKEQCNAFIRFEVFDSATADLARSLKVGGLLFIEYSNFRFCDTKSYAEFEAVGSAAEPADRCPIYDRDNRLMPGLAYREVAFRKVGSNRIR
jgi:SAM-dependent methyltransferase